MTPKEAVFAWSSGRTDEVLAEIAKDKQLLAELKADRARLAAMEACGRLDGCIISYEWYRDIKKMLERFDAGHS